MKLLKLLLLLAKKNHQIQCKSTVSSRFVSNVTFYEKFLPTNKKLYLYGIFLYLLHTVKEFNNVSIPTLKPLKKPYKLHTTAFEVLKLYSGLSDKYYHYITPNHNYCSILVSRVLLVLSSINLVLVVFFIFRTKLAMLLN